ncbi:MAG: hypothetical protein HY584_01615 [Candidatus Omnitrophica bacterium]|nr:hypothetical protein [Candidatus Omnitrophota bacterium]
MRIFAHIAILISVMFVIAVITSVTVNHLVADATRERPNKPIPQRNMLGKADEAIPEKTLADFAAENPGKMIVGWHEYEEYKGLLQTRSRAF